MQAFSVALGLSQPFGYRQAAFLSLNHPKLLAAVDQHIIRDVLFRPLACSLQPAQGNHLAPHPAGIHHAPARSLQGGVDQLGSCFCLIHRRPTLAMIRK